MDEDQAPLLFNEHAFPGRPPDNRYDRLAPTIISAIDRSPWLLTFTPLWEEQDHMAEEITDLFK